MMDLEYGQQNNALMPQGLYPDPNFAQHYPWLGEEDGEFVTDEVLDNHGDYGPPMHHGYIPRSPTEQQQLGFPDLEATHHLKSTSNDTDFLYQEEDAT